MNDRTRDKPLKHLQICDLCGGYMNPISTFGTEPVRQHWKDETFRRSFGGKELRRFVCEKCHHEETFQVDDLEHIKEDD